MTRYEVPWYDEPPVSTVHLATPGFPGGVRVQHPSGECAWCDAERWRDVWAEAPKDGHRAHIDTIILY